MKYVIMDGPFRYFLGELYCSFTNDVMEARLFDSIEAAQYEAGIIFLEWMAAELTIHPINIEVLPGVNFVKPVKPYYQNT